MAAVALTIFPLLSFIMFRVPEAESYQVGKDSVTMYRLNTIYIKAS